MGILRTDRVSGLGGANAIKGSVNFGSSDLQSYDKNLAITNTSDLDIGAGNYTIEYWFNCDDNTSDGFNTSIALSEYTNGSSNNAFNLYHYNNGFRIYNRTGGSFPLLFQNDDSWITGKWHHFAWVREGTGSNENKIYLDGALLGSAFTNDVNYTSGQHWLIGANFYTGSEGYGVNPQYGWSGHLSNVRVSNVARYSGAFTPPTSEYVVDSNTIILACQSPSNILQEETGKEVTYYVGNAFATSEGSGNYFLNSPPQASRFTPNSPVGFSTTSDVGTQFGTTFDGVTTFDSQAYMVVPGGNTRERNRGRGLILGGATGSPSTNTDIIKYFDVASQGITETFGNLTDPDGNGRRSLASLSSSTRACTGGGYSHGGSPGTVKNIIDFVTIATTGNATDFGDMQNTAYAYAPASNQTRGLFAGGYQPNNSSVVNTIDLITIATAGNGSNFGDLTVRRRALAGLESTTRGVFAGGTFPAVHDEIDFVTFSTTGNATDFGDLTDERDNVRASSSSTRGVMAGGRDPSNTNIIDFITIASAGNATDFGDLLSAKFYYAATGNKTRAVWAGDNSGTNAMEFVTIATTGNGVDFGDQNGTPQHYNGCASDSHGGLE